MFSFREYLFNRIAWNPTGEWLAVPGPNNEIRCIERDLWSTVFTLKGGHNKVCDIFFVLWPIWQPVSLLSWSPNGYYLASVGIDYQIVIWDLSPKSKRETLERYKHDSLLSGIAWHPKANKLAVVLECLLCHSYIPRSMSMGTEEYGNRLFLPNFPTHLLSQKNWRKSLLLRMHLPTCSTMTMRNFPILCSNLHSQMVHRFYFCLTTFFCSTIARGKTEIRADSRKSKEKAEEIRNYRRSFGYYRWNGCWSNWMEWWS